MASILNMRMEGDSVFIEGIIDNVKARHLLREAIDDIGDAIEQQVQRTVPVGTGEGPFAAGRLKAHPLDRDDTRIGVTTDIAAFGGQASVRGAGGRFVGAIPSGIEAGRLVAKTEIRLPQEPEHARWVHEGTGVYGPRNSPIRPRTAKFMQFRYLGKNWRVRTVKGQRPQPYLTNAYLLIDRTYIPARLQLLDAQIAAAT